MHAISYLITVMTVVIYVFSGVCVSGGGGLAALPAFRPSIVLMCAFVQIKPTTVSQVNTNSCAVKSSVLVC